MESERRPLSVKEQQALRKMLAVEFRNHRKLLDQVNDLALRQSDETLFELMPLSSQSAALSSKTFGVPVECTYRDEDGKRVHVDLFVNEQDALAEIEVWKPDGSAVLTYFADADLTVTALKIDKG